MTYLDKTFCASPNCTNKCGRKMTEDERKHIPDFMPVAYAYFCGVDKHDSINYNEIDLEDIL